MVTSDNKLEGYPSKTGEFVVFHSLITFASFGALGARLIYRSPARDNVEMDPVGLSGGQTRASRPRRGHQLRTVGRRYTGPSDQCIEP